LSSRRRHTRFHVTGVQTCALPILNSDDDASKLGQCSLDSTLSLDGITADGKFEDESLQCAPEEATSFASKTIEGRVESVGSWWQIGRASCRERVWMWRGARSLETR